MLAAWKEFLRGKKNKPDVQEFSLRLMDHILHTIDELANKRYTHGPYYAFNISDPKPRNIHKATVKDRLLHHAIYRILYPFFDKTFIADSYSCRKNKGTHKAMERFKYFFRKVSDNTTRTCFVLKCDVKKFFATIDHSVLVEILKQYIPDRDIIWFLEKIISSFHSYEQGKGLPLGNLTSQLLVNIYMNEFDQWMKRELQAKYYIRYADDFVIMSDDKKYLEEMIPKVKGFLEERLKLSLHPDKVYIKTFASGVDFLGWVHFPHHRVLRTATKRKMLRRLGNNPKKETIQSYFGLISHGNTHTLKADIQEMIRSSEC